MSGTRSKGKGKAQGKGKKSGKADDDVYGGRSKKRRYVSDSDDDDDMPSKRGSPSVSKLASNRGNAASGHDKPAELFRKDLISAMKLPDSEPLLQEEYILISDPWRQEWEKGVQVPVNPDCIPAAEIRTIRESDQKGDFKLPRKLLHAAQDEGYRTGYHELTGMSQLADMVCRYDLDDQDLAWLQLMNQEREEMGLTPVDEWTMERVMEELEVKCHDNMEAKIKNSEGLGIEYDEDVVCDVCRSPDSEENNEMVFCDNCDICVHQACYGIMTIPDGTWLCRTCALGIKPRCLLCPKTEGAMKSTKSGTKWAHVSCALWIPEVSIGCVDKMEPITKISMIPTSRWALVCCLCRERVGACIQCSVKSCKTAFHVTCAFQHSLEMKTILDENDFDDGVKLKAFCPKHTRHIKERGVKISELDGYRSPKKDGNSMPLSPAKKDMTEAERENLRLQKIEELKEVFYTCVTVEEVLDSLLASSTEGVTLQLGHEAVDMFYEYWKLKRKSLYNKALMTPKRDEADLLNKQQENSLIARMKMFVHLRQDLERVRNLCYMVGRREKIRRSYYKLREQIFRKQIAYLDLCKPTKDDVDVAREASVKCGAYDDPELLLKADQMREKRAQQLDSQQRGLAEAKQTCDDNGADENDSNDVLDDEDDGNDLEDNSSVDEDEAGQKSSVASPHPDLPEEPEPDVTTRAHGEVSRRRPLRSRGEDLSGWASPPVVSTSPKYEAAKSPINPHLSPHKRTVRSPTQDPLPLRKRSQTRYPSISEKSNSNSTSSTSSGSEDEKGIESDSFATLQRAAQEEDVDLRSPDRSKQKLDLKEVNKSPRRSPFVDEKETNRELRKRNMSTRSDLDEENLQVKLNKVNRTPSRSPISDEKETHRELRKRNMSMRSDIEEDKPKVKLNNNLFDIKKEDVFEEKPVISRDFNDMKRLASQFVLSKRVRDKVQSKVYSSRRLRPVINGLHDTTQRRLDAYFKPIPRKTFNNRTPNKNSNSNANEARDLRVALRSPMEEFENRSGGNSPSFIRNYRNSTRKENTPTAATRRSVKTPNLYEASTETRSSRRKLGSVDSDDRVFENVNRDLSSVGDGDSPLSPSRSLRSRGQDIDVNTLAPLKSRTPSNSGLGLDEVFVDVVNSSGELSDGESVVSGPTLRTTRSSKIDDDSSCDSTHSVTRYPTRSR